LASKKKRTKKQNLNRNIKEILAGKISVTALELIRLIHKINPTREDASNAETRNRYSLKAQLQSLLIQKFKDNLIVMPDPDNPELVSLQLKHFDENACHALVQELDDAARSWVKMEMDTKGPDCKNTAVPPATQQFPSSQAPKATRSRETYTADELLSLGAKALETYDYDACEDFLFRAFSLSQGALPATRALFEFLVDYLAAHERVVEIGVSLSQECKKDSLVSAKLALALASTNRMEEALALVARSRDTFAMPVYVLGVENFISRNDLDGAESLCKRLSLSQDHEFTLKGGELLAKIEKLRVESLAPREQEMTALWHEKQFNQANKIARNILEQVPNHQGARKLHRAFTRMQKWEKTVEFIQMADSAKVEKDFNREAMLLKKALDINPDDAKAPGISSRIELALNKARKQREQAQINEVASLWQKGDRKTALMFYVCLSPSQQEQCRSLITDVCLTWADELKAALPSIKPEKAAGTVLLLGKALRMLAENQDPIHVHEQMEDVQELLLQIKEGRELLDRVKKRIKTGEIERAKKFLERAVQFLEQDRMLETREVIDSLRPELLDIQERQLLDGLIMRLVKCEQIESLEKTHAIAGERQDYFVAREAARKLSLLVETDQDESLAGVWRKKIEEETELIQKKWAAIQCKELKLTSSILTTGLYRYNDTQASAALMPDGRHIALVSNLGSRIFIRLFDCDNQRFDQAVMISPPLPMDFPTLCLEGETIWIGGGAAGVFSITLAPFDIVSWKDCTPFVEKDHVLEDVWLFPRHNTVWLHLRPMRLNHRETFRVINLELNREVRKANIEGVPWLMNQRGDFQIGDSPLETGTINIYSGSGHQEKSLAKTIPGYVEKSVIHPDGHRRIFLIYDEAGEAHSRALKIPGTEGFSRGLGGQDEPIDAIYLEVLPAPGDSPVFQRISYSNGQAESRIATSIQKGLVFVHCHITESDGEKSYLFAFNVHPDRFEEVYKVEVPSHFFFASDELCGDVAGVVPGQGGIQSVILDHHPPGFSHSDSLPELSGNGIPRVNDHAFCSMASGKIYDISLEFTERMEQNSFKAIQMVFKNMKHEADQDPDELFAFHVALSKDRLYSELAKEVEKWAQERFPDHPRTLLLRANQALAQMDWPTIIFLLKDLDLHGIDNGTVGHICHIMGLALFSTEEVTEAIAVWKHGKSLKESKCPFDFLIDYGNVAVMSDLDREKAKTRGDYPEILELIETMDRFLELKNWEGVIQAALYFEMDSITNSQILARLAKALLKTCPDHGKKEWLEKLILLELFLKKTKDRLFKRLCLPPHMVTWPETQIQSLVEESTLWLGRQVG